LEVINATQDKKDSAINANAEPKWLFAVIVLITAKKNATTVEENAKLCERNDNFFLF
jgi:hypothetical protein